MEFGETLSAGDSKIIIFRSFAKGRDMAAEIVKKHFTSLPAGTTMATKDLLLDIYNEIMGTTNGSLQEEQQQQDGARASETCVSEDTSGTSEAQ